MKVIGDLNIEGKVKITGGDPGTDKILTSDASGLASWENLSSMIGGLITDTNTHVVSGIITTTTAGGGKLPDVTTLVLTKSDGSEVIIDVSDLKDDWQTKNLSFNTNTNVLTLMAHNPNKGDGQQVKNYTVDLSSITSGLSAGDNDWTVVGNNMYSNPSGNIGIGTNTPVDKLHVKDGDIFVDGDNRSVWIGGNGDNDNPRLRLHSGTGGSYIDWEAPNSPAALHFRSDTTTKVTITPTGLMGIGTTSPAQKLHVAGNIYLGANDQSQFVHCDGNFALSSDANLLIVTDSNDTSPPEGTDIILGGGSEIDTNQNKSFTFGQAYPTLKPKTEYMRIKGNTGYVGVGTSSPDSRLHVEGQVKIQDGTQGDGKVLTSDANGLAAWKTAQTGSGNGGTSFPIGSIIQYAGSSAPAGWLLCDGKSYNENAYTKLFNVIGLTYGAGEGTWVPGGELDSGTDFRVPLLNGRVPVGRNIGDADFGNLGQMSGEREVTLKDSEIPYKSHQHTIDKGGSGHFHPINWVHDGEAGLKTDGTGDGRAYHVLNAHAFKSLNVGKNYLITGNHTFGDGDGVGCSSLTNVADTAFQDKTQGEHSHSMSTGSATSNSGGGPHNNLQPYIVLNYIIYAGV